MTASLYQCKLSSSAIAGVIPTPVQIICAKVMTGCGELIPQRREELLHFLPGCRIRLCVICYRHVEFLPGAGCIGVCKSMGGAVVADEGIGTADRIHLLFENRDILWRHKLIGVAMTDEDLRSQKVLASRGAEQAPVEADDPTEIIAQPRGVQQYAPTKTIADRTDLPGID